MSNRMRSYRILSSRSSSFASVDIEDCDHSQINRLTISNRFYGRQDELEELEQIYRDFCLSAGMTKNLKNAATATATAAASSFSASPSSSTKIGGSAKTPIVLLSGYSGCGKSALVEQFGERIQAMASRRDDGNSDEGANRQQQIKPCHFLSGKFDDSQGTDPLSAIVAAFSIFVNNLLQGDTEVMERTKRNILKAVGDEVTVLTDVVPTLQGLLGKQTSQTCTNPCNEYEGNRLRYAFGRFVQAICNDHCPVILFLDDLQWADEASLDLIIDLATNMDLKHFMIIGTYRSNEVDENHPLTSRLIKIHALRLCYRIVVGNLSEEAIGQFIADSLRLDVSETASLANVLYKKTQGNIFFTRQLLEDLRQSNVLSVSISTYKWTWDIEKVESAAAMSDNVIDVVTATINTLPHKLQRTLSIAAYLRSLLDLHTLLGLMQMEEDPIKNMEELVHLLEVAVSKNWLRKEGRSYRFSHDRIKQACSALIPLGDGRKKLHLRIGRYLKERGNDPWVGEDWMLFVAADHLNSVPSNELPPLDLANLNLRVGEKAIQVAAFVPAASYLRRGLEFLERIDSPWRSNYDITLRLHQAAADVELCLGNFERGSKLCHSIRLNTKSIKDKLLVSLSLAGALGRIQRNAEAMEVHKEALYLVGEFPRRFRVAYLMRNLWKVKKLFKKFTDEEILGFPQMNNETKQLAMEHLTNLGIRAHVCSNVPVLIVCALKQLTNTFKHGICSVSAVAFAVYGAVLVGFFGDVKSATRMSRLARLSLERIKQVDKRGAKYKECHVLYVVSAFIDAHTSPPSKVSTTLQRSYKSGMETGEIEKAFRSLVGACYFSYLAGLPLDLLENSSSRLLEQILHYNADGLYAIFSQFHFAVVHLMGNTETPLDWTTELTSRFMRDGEASKVEPSMRFAACRFFWTRIQLAYYFREFDIAGRMIEPFRVLSKTDKAFVSSSVRIYFSGLVSVALARKTKKKAYLKRAKKAMREMKTVVMNNGVNNIHRYLLLKAEITAFGCNNLVKVKVCYDAAISTASRAGFRQDAALGNELAAEYTLSIGDESWASHYFTAAHALYRDWGAFAKADHLLKLRGSYIDSVSMHSSSLFGPMSHLLGDETLMHESVNLEMLGGKKALDDLLEISKSEESESGLI